MPVYDTQVYLHTYTHIFKMFLCIYNVVIKVPNLSRVMRRFVGGPAPRRFSRSTSDSRHLPIASEFTLVSIFSVTVRHVRRDLLLPVRFVVPSLKARARAHARARGVCIAKPVLVYQTEQSRTENKWK